MPWPGAVRNLILLKFSCSFSWRMTVVASQVYCWLALRVMKSRCSSISFDTSLDAIDAMLCVALKLMLQEAQTRSPIANEFSDTGVRSHRTAACRP